MAHNVTLRKIVHLSMRQDDALMAEAMPPYQQMHERGDVLQQGTLGILDVPCEMMALLFGQILQHKVIPLSPHTVIAVIIGPP